MSACRAAGHAKRVPLDKQLEPPKLTCVLAPTSSMLMVEVLVDRMASLRQARSRSAKICCLIFRFCGGPVDMPSVLCRRGAHVELIACTHSCNSLLIDRQMLHNSVCGYC